MPAAIGLGIFFAVISVIVQIAVIVYFFVLFYRLTNCVARIEQRCVSIEHELQNLHK